MANPMRTQTVGTRQGWQFECSRENGEPEDCGFLLRDHVLPELVQLAQTHAKQSHKVDITDAYVRSVSKAVTF